MVVKSGRVVVGADHCRPVWAHPRYYYSKLWPEGMIWDEPDLTGIRVQLPMKYSLANQTSAAVGKI